MLYRLDKHVESKVRCRRVLSAGHALAVDVAVVVAAVAREGKAIMALSTQTIVATAFIMSVTGYRGLLPRDGDGFTVRTFPQVPKVKTNILKYAQIKG